MTTRDLEGPGTPEAIWKSAGLPDELPELDWDALLAGSTRVVVVAPHPDDEVLGVGGILAELALRKVPVLVVAVTDGEASHPGRAEELRTRRAQERTLALGALHSTAAVTRLGIPDGRVNEFTLHSQLATFITAADLVLAPWSKDGHPDHDACGRAVRGLGKSMWSYLVWTWHWSAPRDFPRDRAVRVALTQQQQTAKRNAVAAYISQLEGERPILPSHVQVRLLRDSEVLLASSV